MGGCFNSENPFRCVKKDKKQIGFKRVSFIRLRYLNSEHTDYVKYLNVFKSFDIYISKISLPSFFFVSD